MSGVELAEDVATAVLDTWRDAAVLGMDLDARLEMAIEAYTNAGGAAEGARDAVADILSAGARERGDWLFGPDVARIEGRSPPLDYPPARGWPERQPGDPLDYDG